MAKHPCHFGKRHVYGAGAARGLGCIRCGYKPPLTGTQEKDVQKSIVEFLTLEGWRVFEFNKEGAGVYRLPKKNPLDPAEKQRWRSVRGGTVPEDWPDIVAIQYAITAKEFVKPDGQWRAVCLFLEVKAPGKVSTPGQVQFREWINAMHGYAYEVDNLDDVARILACHMGMKLRFYTLGKGK